MKKIKVGTLTYSALMSGAIIGGTACFLKWRNAQLSAEFWKESYKKELKQRLDWQYLAKGWTSIPKTDDERWDEYKSMSEKWLDAETSSD